MKHSWHTLALWAGLALIGPAAWALTPEQVQALPPPAKHPINFARDIKPIFEASCIKCHGRGRNKGGFALDTRDTLLRGGDDGPVAVPGKSAQSYIIELVAGVDPDNTMPQKGKLLTPEEVGLLRAWIDAGLPWDPNITFSRPAPVNLLPHQPQMRVSVAANQNPLDPLLDHYFATNHFSPPPVVEDRVFARRVYLDTIGLLPTPAELDAFLADGDPGKRAKLVQRLLADNQHYAEHWLSFWNDMLRNDYRGTGYIDGGRKPITAWLYSALSTNMPYDRFVAQLIDPVPGSAGFTKGIVWRGIVNASQSPAMQAAQNISQVFMGVNLKCASCHDSFVDDWRLSDSYGLASIYSDGPLQLFFCDKPTGKTAEARFIYPELGTIDPHADKAARLKRLAEIITGPKDGRLSRTIVNRLWARFFGRGLIEPVDVMEQPAWDPDVLDCLAEDLVAHHYDLKVTIERMLTCKAYQLPAVDLGEAAVKGFAFRGPAVRRLSAEQFRDAVGEVTGVWMAKAAFTNGTQQVRASLAVADPLAVALGRPDREQVVTTRASEATTLQALELTNGKTLAKVIERGAERLAAGAPGSEQLVDNLYRATLGREPSSAEREMAQAVVGQPVRKDGVEDLLWAMVMLPEFQLIY